jgi:hypothetical protein
VRFVIKITQLRKPCQYCKAHFPGTGVIPDRRRTGGRESFPGWTLESMQHKIPGRSTGAPENDDLPVLRHGLFSMGLLHKSPKPLIFYRFSLRFNSLISMT